MTQVGDGAGTSLRAATRLMTVIAQDPSIKNRKGGILTARIEVPAEELIPGPIGYRVQVVDYDTSTGVYHGAYELPESVEKEPGGWAKGDDSIVGSRRFHAQNVYALMMKTLARFEYALGRRVGWSFGGHQLKVAPNGVMDANAFYSRDIEGLVFGYFPGRGKKTIYTCLSHDVVVHETTHALLDALRRRYLDPSGADQAAFHEAFADVIALLSVFSQVELVQELLQREAGRSPYIAEKDVDADALRASTLFGLAEQMGEEMHAVRGEALRRSAKIPPGRKWLEDPEYEEPHLRGEILVAAVMNAFIKTWTWRLDTTKGEGQTRYAVKRVAEEGCDIAAALATVWIRALDYMPPVHITFSDALSAAITADLEVRPDDRRFNLRTHLLESFKAYGIEPASTRPDAVGAWEFCASSLNYDRVRFDSMRSDKDEVFRFIWENRKSLGVREGAYTEVLSVHPCIRLGKDGFALRETVAEYYQVARLTEDELREKKIRLPDEYADELRSVRAQRDESRSRTLQADAEPLEADTLPVTPIYGGGVLIFDEWGKLKYHIHKGIFDSERQSERLEYLWQTGQLEVGRGGDARLSPGRLSAIHRSRAIGVRRFANEGW